MMPGQLLHQRLLKPNHIRIVTKTPPPFDPDAIAGADGFHYRAKRVKKRHHLLLVWNGHIQAAQFGIRQNRGKIADKLKGKIGINTVGYPLPFKLLPKITLREGMRERIADQPELPHLEAALSKNK
jgi:hypothetical protein